MVVKVEFSGSVAYTGAFVTLETCIVYKNHAIRAKREARSSRGLWNVNQFDGAGESKSRGSRSQRDELTRGGSSGKFLKVLRKIGLSSFRFLIEHTIDHCA